jgi:hypothetical protein
MPLFIFLPSCTFLLFTSWGLWGFCIFSNDQINWLSTGSFYSLVLE